MGRFGQEAQRAGSSANRSFDRASDSARRTHDQLGALRNQIVGVVGAFAGIQGVRQIASLADTYTQLQNRIRTVTEGQEQLADVSDRLLGIAQRTRQSWVGTAEVYARTALSAEELNVSQQDLLNFAESLNQAAVLSGASAQEAEAAMIQLSQGLASGELRGEELRSVLEQLPVVADIIAKQMNATRGDLLEFGEAGEISANIVIEAFRNAREELSERFAETLPTIEQGWMQVSNAVTEYVGRVDQATGVSSAIAGTLGDVAESITQLSVDVQTLQAIMNTGEAAFFVALAVGAGRTSSAMAGVAKRTAESIAATEQLNARNAAGAQLASSLAAARARATAATVADTRATLSAITAARAETEAQLQRANASVQAAQAAIQASRATGTAAQTSGILRRAEQELTVALRERQAAMAQLAALGQQQARVNAALASATTANTAAQARAATASTAAASALQSVSLSGRATARGISILRGGLALLGGPLGAAVTGLTLLFFWTQRNQSIANDLEPTVRTVRELADEATRLREGGGLLSNEQAEAIARSREEIERAAQAVAILTEQRNQALNAGQDDVAGELLEEINAIVAGIKDRSDAIRDLQDAIRPPTDTVTESAEEASDEVAKLIERQRTLVQALRDGAEAQEAETRARLAAKGASEQQIQTYLRLQSEEQQIRNQQEQARRAAEEVRQALADLRQDSLTAAQQVTAEFEQRMATLQDLLGENLIDDAEFRQLADSFREQFWDQIREDADEATDEIRRTFERRFGEDLSDALLDSLQTIEQVREAFGSIDGPFTQSIDRMLAGLQTFNVAAERTGEAQVQLYASGTAQMLSGVQQLASQGSSAYEQIGIAVQALQSITAIQAILNAGATGDPFTAVARMATMAGIVASLGVSVAGAFSGGGSGYQPGDITGSTGRGTVFGAPDTESASIANSVDLTAEAAQELVGINTRMLRSLESLQAQLGNVGNLLVREDIDPASLSQPSAGRNRLGGLAALNATGLGANGLFMLGLNNTLTDFVDDAFETIGLDFVGDLVGGLGDVLGGALESAGSAVFGGDQELRGYGIRIIGGALTDLMESVVADSFSRIRESGGLLGGGPDYRTEFGDVPDAVGNQFRLIFERIGQATTEAASVLGVSRKQIEYALSQFDVDEIRIDLQGRTGEEINEQVNAVFSALFDDVAAAVVPFVDQFARVGEGAAETLTRIASNLQVAEAGLDRIGADYGIPLKPETAAQLATSLVDAAGGYSEFAGMTQSFVDDFLSQSERLDVASREATAALAQIGLQLPETRDGFRQLVEGFQVTDAASAQTLTTLLQLAPALDEIYSASERVQEEAHDLRIRLLRAQGEEQAAREADRQQQLASINENNRALLEQIFAAEDAARAEEQLRQERESAAQLAQQRAGLEIELLRAQGNEEEALRLERERQIAQMPTSLQAIQRQIFAEQDLAAERQRAAEIAEQSLSVLRAFDQAPSAFEEVLNSLGLVRAELPRTAAAMGEFLLTLSESQRATLAPYISDLQSVVGNQVGAGSYQPAYGNSGQDDAERRRQEREDALRQAYEAESRELEERVDQFGRFTESLRDFGVELDELLATAASGPQRLGQLRAEFDDVARRARLGEASALEALPDVGRSLVDQIQRTATNRLEFDRQVAQVRAEALAAADTADRQRSIAEQQLDALTDQVSALIEIEQAVLSVAEAIEQLGGPGYATGGVATGPASGYVTRLHGTEGVVPLEGGRAIPVITYGNRKSEELLAEILRQLEALNEVADPGLSTIADHTERTASVLRRLTDGYRLRVAIDQEENEFVKTQEVA
ncbi:tape measure protein [Algiphilus sp.]|uniref:tape measure protein n=1 Tax=Algiphilus sp. TaxID=1872431 RepID=UPI0025C28AE2|nr:tape measure protein [Algiphilus sp.]MCK5772048.1 tape measure protein [Algiphilus sp.]